MLNHVIARADSTLRRVRSGLCGAMKVVFLMLPFVANVEHKKKLGSLITLIDDMDAANRCPYLYAQTNRREKSSTFFLVTYIVYL